MTIANEELLAKLADAVRDLGHKVELLVGDKDFNTRVPLELREAAAICHVELVWLREKVTRKEIPAYRPGPNSPWRVFPKDVQAFVMASNNKERIRRKSVLRNVA